MIAWTVASQQFSVPNPSCVGLRHRVTSSDTVASRTFAVGRRRVSRAAMGRWLPFFFRGAGNPGDGGARVVALCHDLDYGMNRLCFPEEGRVGCVVGEGMTVLLSSPAPRKGGLLGPR